MSDFPLTPGWSRGTAKGRLSSGAQTDVLLRKKGGDCRAFASAIAVAGGQEQTGQPRMDRQCEHVFSQWRYPRGVAVDGAQQAEEVFCLCQTLGFRCVEPIEVLGVGNAPRVQGEHRAGEVDAVDLGLLQIRDGCAPRAGTKGGCRYRARCGRLARHVGRRRRD